MAKHEQGPVSPRTVIDMAGGARAVADALQIRPNAVYFWMKAPPDTGRTAQIPAARVLDLERLSGVSRHRIRPDVFGPEPAAVNDSAA